MTFVGRVDDIRGGVGGSVFDGGGVTDGVDVTDGRFCVGGSEGDIEEGGFGGSGDVMADLGVKSCPDRVRSAVDLVLPSTRRTSAIRLRVRSNVDLVRR